LTQVTHDKYSLDYNKAVRRHMSLHKPHKPRYELFVICLSVSALDRVGSEHH